MYNIIHILYTYDHTQTQTRTTTNTQAVLAKWEARRERYIKIEKRTLPQVGKNRQPKAVESYGGKGVCVCVYVWCRLVCGNVHPFIHSSPRPTPPPNNPIQTQTGPRPLGHPQGRHALPKDEPGLLRVRSHHEHPPRRAGVPGHGPRHCFRHGAPAVDAQVSTHCVCVCAWVCVRGCVRVCVCAWAV